VLVVRTQKSFFKSRPGKYLVITTLLVLGVTLALPFTPVGKLLGFTSLPFQFFLLMGVIVVLYIITAEWVKKLFYRKIGLYSNAKLHSNEH
jgi:P-type Mg2+ transporter